MKKGVILIVFLLAISLVSAQGVDFNEVMQMLENRSGSGEVVEGSVVFDLADFEDEPIQAVEVSKGDMMMFEMFGQTHGLFIKDLIKDNVKIVFFPNKVEGQSSKGAGSLPLKEGRMIQIDVNLDGDNDLAIRLYEIGEERAVLLLEDRRGSVETSVPTGSGVVPLNDNQDGNTNRNVFLVLALVVFGLLGILGVKKFRKRDENEGYVEIKPEDNSDEDTFSE